MKGIKLTNLEHLSIAFLSLTSQTWIGGFTGDKNLGMNVLLPSMFSKKAFTYLLFGLNLS